MLKKLSFFIKNKPRVFSWVLALVLALGVYRYYHALVQRIDETNQRLDTIAARIETRLNNLADNISRVDVQSSNLTGVLKTEQDKSGSFAKKIDEISSTVGALDKLSKTDRELLQKYSKVYFLNENYVPTNLIKIDPNYLANKDKTIEIHANVWSFLKQMLGDAATSKLPITIVSGYRSFGTQAVLKSSYRLTYGAGTANQFSAEQGFSEHQLGTTVDLTTPEIGDTLNGFDHTAAYLWLTVNAHRYGFTLSYPSGNAYYQFEPWHWRFVGVELATKLHNENKHFYDLDQRVIDQYLIKIFD